MNRPNGRPYLSVVLCGRNDNYGDNYLQRLQNLVDSVDALRGGAEVEIVFVEWNPPPENDSLRRAIDWGCLATTIVTVPAAVHARIPVNHEGSAIHEFIGKNVGIRRARGEFVLCCNSDVIFSEALFSFFARRQLPAGYFYRAARIDIEPLPGRLGRSADPAPLCRERAYQAHLLDGSVQVGRPEVEAIIRGNMLAMGDFDRHFRGLFGLQESGVVTIEAAALKSFPHLIFTNGSGDFLLMSAEDWLRVGGYLENDCRNHIDSLLCFRAVQAGLGQALLPLAMAVFHQRHTPAQLRDYFATLQVLRQAVNPPEWGLAGEELPVERLAAAACTPGA